MKTNPINQHKEYYGKKVFVGNKILKGNIH